MSMNRQYDLVNTIIIHCSDSPRGRGDGAAAIDLWHRERGFDMIGYHYVILEDGNVENGRPEFIQGAHVRGHNKGSIGICLIGDDHPTVLQSASLAHMVRDIMTRHEIKTICGHRELDSGKSCPNFDIDEWLERMNHVWAD